MQENESILTPKKTILFMGFETDLENITVQATKERQICLYSTLV